MASAQRATLGRTLGSLRLRRDVGRDDETISSRSSVISMMTGVDCLANARCLAEGVDVPSIDGVAFIDPRRSQIDIVQAVGRAIRKSEEKIGTIVLPAFIDEGADPEASLDASAFIYIGDVLKALRAHDEQLAEELDELRRELGRRGAAGRRLRKIKFDLPVGVSKRFVDAFDARLVEATTESWEFWFGLLQRYVEREEHARPPVWLEEEGHRPREVGGASAQVLEGGNARLGTYPAA